MTLAPYHVGDTLGLKTKAATGRLFVEDDRIVIQGDSQVSIPFKSLRSVELFRLHGTGRMLKIIHTEGTVFGSVIRFSLFGYFAIVNFFETGKLARLLQAQIHQPDPA